MTGATGRKTKKKKKKPQQEIAKLNLPNRRSYRDTRSIPIADLQAKCSNCPERFSTSATAEDCGSIGRLMFLLLNGYCPAKGEQREEREGSQD